MSSESIERPPLVGGVAALAAITAGAAALLTFVVLEATQRHSDLITVPRLLVVAGFFLTEIFLVHFEHRRESHSVSFSAIPLVIGLYTLTPLALVATRLIGSVAALGVARRQAPIKLSVNLASFWLETAVAITVFRLLAPEGSISLASWPAAAVAAVAADLVQAVVITGAIGLYQRRWEVLAAPAILGPIVSLANTAIAVVAITLVAAEPWALALLATLVPVLFVSYRVHADLREQHRHLEQLYEFGRVVSDAVLGGRVVGTLLHHMQELLHADDAWICVPSEAGAVRVRTADGDSAVPVRMPAGAIDQRLHDAACAAGRPLLLDADHPELGETLAALGIRQALVAPLAPHDERVGSVVISDRSGEVRPFDDADVRLFTMLVHHAGASLENSHLLDRLREQAAASEHQALHDSLTGLPNRLLFAQRVRSAIQSGSPLAVLLLDLDRFKEVNDTLGHHNGDVLLQEVGKRLATGLRTGDTVARLGGDEFAVLLPGVDSPPAAVHVARDLLAVLEQPISLSGVTIAVGGSIGIAVSPHDGADPALLLQRADVAMYTAKADQTAVESYRPDRDIYSPDRLALAAELRRAIERDELEVHYQPQLDLLSGEVIGAEALVRWIQDEKQRLSPVELVGLAEQTGLIGSITRLVLRSAVRECSTWWANGWPLRISVNLSARMLLDDELPAVVRATLSEHGLPASALCLELTETTIMEDQDHTVAVLERLQEVGVTVAIDDFGVGYSSLAYLARLPVGEIKIDKSFVLSMPHVESDELIVRSVVDLAFNLGIPVVAEGVETEEAREALEALGCQYAQGYLFSRPLPPADFAAWLTGHTAARPPLNRPCTRVTDRPRATLAG